jgi:hypothetical protein
MYKCCWPRNNIGRESHDYRACCQNLLLCESINLLISGCRHICYVISWNLAAVRFNFLSRNEYLITALQHSARAGPRYITCRQSQGYLNRGMTLAYFQDWLLLPFLTAVYTCMLIEAETRAPCVWIPAKISVVSHKIGNTNKRKMISTIPMWHTLHIDMVINVLRVPLITFVKITNSNRIF